MKDSVKCNPAKSKMPSETLTRNYGAIMKEHENDPLFVCTKEWFQKCLWNSYAKGRYYFANEFKHNGVRYYMRTLVWKRVGI